MTQDELAQHYRDVRTRLYGRAPVVRRPAPYSPPVVLPITDGRSLAEFPDEPMASTPCPLNMLTPCSWRFLVAYCAAKHRVGKDQILSAFRGRQVVAARAEAIYLVRTHVHGSGLMRLGHLFGRDHTTILSSLRRYEERKRNRDASTLSTVSTGTARAALTLVPLGETAARVGVYPQTDI